jgi:hypothetical protein
LIDCDHALVVADIDARALRKANPKGEAQRPLAKASIDFIQLGRKRKREKGIPLMDSIEEQMTSEGGRLEAVYRAMMELRLTITQLEQNSDPDNEADRTTQLLTVHQILIKCMHKVYEPIVRWAVQSKFLARSAGPNTTDRSMNHDRYSASKQLQGALGLKLKSRNGKDDEDSPTIPEMAARHHDNWVRFRDVMKPGWPNITQEFEDDSWPDIPENLRLELQLLRIVGGARKEEREREVKILEDCKREMDKTRRYLRKTARSLHIDGSCDAVMRDFECGNISGVFQKVFPKKNIGPNATTPDQYVKDGKVKSAETAAEARRAEEQKWEKLYCVNKFHRPPFMKFTERLPEDGLPSAEFNEKEKDIVKGFSEHTTR